MNEIKTGAVLNYVSIGLNTVVGLIYTPYMLRMLGQSEYGLYSLASSVIAYLTVLDLGFGNAIVRYTAKFRAEGKKKEQEYMFGMFFLLYCAIGLITFVLGAILANHASTIFSNKLSSEEIYRTQIMLWLMTFNLAFTFPMSIWGSIMSAYERFIFQRVINISRIVLNPLVMIILLSIGYKAIAMVVVTTLFNIITLLINWAYCKSKLHINLKYGNFKWEFFKEVSIYSFWIFLNIIMDRIYWSTGQFILGIYRGAVSIAIYSVAIQLQGMYMMFSTAISGVLLPKVTAMITKENNEKKVSDFFIQVGRIQFIIMALVLTGFIIFGKAFISLWAGTEYVGAYSIALFFLVPLTVPLIQNLGITILQARNQMKFRSLVYICIAMCCLIISIPLTKYYGGIGCALSVALSLTVGQIIIMNIYYHRKQKLDMVKFWVEISKMSLIPFLFIGVYLINFNFINTWLLNPIHFILGILIFLFIYLPCFWVCSMKKDEKNLIINPIKVLIAQR